MACPEQAISQRAAGAHEKARKLKGESIAYTELVTVADQKPEPGCPWSQEAEAQVCLSSRQGPWTGNEQKIRAPDEQLHAANSSRLGRILSSQPQSSFFQQRVLPSAPSTKPCTPQEEPREGWLSALPGDISMDLLGPPGELFSHVRGQEAGRERGGHKQRPREHPALPAGVSGQYPWERRHPCACL